MRYYAAGRDIFLWQQGRLIKLVAANDPLPGGGVFAYQLTPMSVLAQGQAEPGRKDRDCCTWGGNRES